MTAMHKDFVTMTDLWNGLVRHMGAPVPLGSGSATIREAAAPPQGEIPISFAVSVAGQPVALVITDFPFAAQTRTQLSLADLSSLPTTLRDGLYLGIADSLTETLPKALLSNLTGLELAPVENCETWLEAHLDMGSSGTAICYIGASRAGFCHIFRALYPEGKDGLPRLPAAVTAHIPLHLFHSFGAMRIPLSTLRGLEAGDVLLAGLSTDSSALEGAPGTVCLVRAGEEGTWQFKEFSMSTEEPEKQTPDSEAIDLSEAVASLPTSDATAGSQTKSLHEPETGGIDDIPVRLSFATHSVTKTVAEMQELAEGAVLALDAPVLAPGLPVRILANGAAVGAGHLVQIDDRLAVRVASMGSAGDRKA